MNSPDSLKKVIESRVQMINAKKHKVPINHLSPIHEHASLDNKQSCKSCNLSPSYSFDLHSLIQEVAQRHSDQFTRDQQIKEILSEEDLPPVELKQVDFSTCPAEPENEDSEEESPQSKLKRLCCGKSCILI